MTASIQTATEKRKAAAKRRHLKELHARRSNEDLYKLLRAQIYKLREAGEL